MHFDPMNIDSFNPNQTVKASGANQSSGATHDPNAAVATTANTPLQLIALTTSTSTSQPNPLSQWKEWTDLSFNPSEALDQQGGSDQQPLLIWLPIEPPKEQMAKLQLEYHPNSSSNSTSGWSVKQLRFGPEAQPNEGEITKLKGNPKYTLEKGNERFFTPFPEKGVRAMLSKDKDGSLIALILPVFNPTLQKAARPRTKPNNN